MTSKHPSTMHGASHLWWALVGLCLLLPSSSIAGAQESQQAVRIAYLFNLTKYVSWPRTSKELRICSEADVHTGELLKKILEGRSSQGHVIHVVLGSSVPEQRKCAILYMGNVSAKKTVAILQELGTSPVLTVSDDPQFVRRGGMVGLVRAEDQIQLHVNLEAVHSSGIQISSRLLNIAVIDRTDRRK